MYVQNFRAKWSERKRERRRLPTAEAILSNSYLPLLRPLIEQHIHMTTSCTLMRICLRWSFLTKVLIRLYCQTWNFRAVVAKQILCWKLTEQQGVMSKQARRCCRRNSSQSSQFLWEAMSLRANNNHNSAEWLMCLWANSCSFFFFR